MAVPQGVCVLALLVCVACCSAQQVAILRTRPVFSAVSKDSWNGSSFCATYNTNWTSNLTTSPSLVEYFPLLFSGDGCSGNVSLTDQISVVHRGNCSFLQKAVTADMGGASGLVIVYNSSTRLPFPGGDDDPGIQLPVVMVTSTTGQILQDHKKMGLVAGIYAPPISSSGFDGSLLILFVIAVVTVLLSSVFATKPFAFLKRDLHRPDGPSPEEKEKEEEEAERRRSRFQSSGWWWKILLIVTFVAIVCGFLVLMYFFYYPMVYIVIAMFSIWSCVSLYIVMSPFVSLLPTVCRLPPNKIPILRNRPDIKFFITIVVAVALVIWWVVERHASYAWVLQDILGVAFIMMMATYVPVALDTWMVVALLAMLMVYDIFFVFITPFITHGPSIMVQAITGGSGGGGAVGNSAPMERLPIIFIAPKLMLSELEAVCGSLGGFNTSAILGYGDVAIPCLLVVKCLGFDLLQHPKSRLKLYFLVSAVGYGAGLLLAFLVLVLSRSAQPALLYLVPCTVIPVLLVAAVRRELRAFLKRVKTSKPRLEHTGDIQTLSSLQRSDEEDQKEEEEEEEGRDSEQKQLLISNQV